MGVAIEREKKKNFHKGNFIRTYAINSITTEIFILLYKPNLPNLGEILLLKSLYKHKNSIKPFQYNFEKIVYLPQVAGNVQEKAPCTRSVFMFMYRYICRSRILYGNAHGYCKNSSKFRDTYIFNIPFLPPTTNSELYMYFCFFFACLKKKCFFFFSQKIIILVVAELYGIIFTAHELDYMTQTLYFDNIIA